MIVRTYGRRKPGISRSCSDSFEDDDVLEPLSQETASQDCYYSRPFSSQESSSRFSVFDFDSFGQSLSQENNIGNPFDDGGPKNKKARKEKSLGRGVSGLVSTSTLMEAQEFGEMMEHVDEVNFALDGLRKGQPIRIRWASLLSLLGICATVQQRRLLRTQGIAKTIIDSVLGLSLDDTTTNLAAATLVYVLTSEGQDDHILESPRCINFLVKLLKPVPSAVREDKASKIGCRLLAFRKDADMLRDKKPSGLGSEAILSKVEEVLVSCKEIKPSSVDNGVVGRLELCPEWMALLTMEKACISTISLDDASGTVTKTGGNFKEKLREFGGLDAVFGVTLSCHSVMENWMEHGISSFCGAKADVRKLMLLLKCLKIMENAAFLSKDNQSHLLCLKGVANLSSPLLFTELILRIIKILSGLYLRKCSTVSNDKKICDISGGNGLPSGFALDVDAIADSSGIISISSEMSSRTNDTSAEESFDATQSSKLLSTGQLEHPISLSDTTTRTSNGSSSVMMRVNSSKSGSCSETSRSSNGKLNGEGTMKKFGFGRRINIEDSKFDILDENQDPFAFDEDDFVPSKWDTLCGKKKKSRIRRFKPKVRGADEGCRSLPLTSHQESSNEEFHPQVTMNRDNYSSNGTSSSNSVDEETVNLLSDCLLTAIKVLMNLTNDNPEGCQQIAASGGLDVLCSLIAHHFPYYSSSSSLRCEMKASISRLELKQQDERHLSDQESDLLVAILGLLVNLVEKDGLNRIRLARASVALQDLHGSQEKNHQDVIPLLCSIFLSNRGDGEAAEDAPWNDAEAAMLEGEKEAEKMIVEAYSALLLAFLSSESWSIRHAIADCLPEHNLEILVPVLERFVAFHLTLNMLTPETHEAVIKVIESCKAP